MSVDREVKHEIPLDACPVCGFAQRWDANVGNDEAVVVREGDISICGDCGGISLYGEGLKRRKLTEAEMFRLMEHEKWPGIRSAQLSVMKCMKERFGNQ
jgi:hypothetical protein